VNELEQIILYSLLSGLTIFVGGILSHYFGLFVKNGYVKKEIVHFSIAFGWGVLIASVSLI